MCLIDLITLMLRDWLSHQPIYLKFIISFLKFYAVNTVHGNSRFLVLSNKRRWYFLEIRSQSPTQCLLSEEDLKIAYIFPQTTVVQRRSTYSFRQIETGVRREHTGKQPELFLLLPNPKKIWQRRRLDSHGAKAIQRNCKPWGVSKALIGECDCKDIERTGQKKTASSIFMHSKGFLFYELMESCINFEKIRFDLQSWSRNEIPFIDTNVTFIWPTRLVRFGSVTMIRSMLR